MQSFAGKVKNELCRVPVQRLCCARAEAYGVLLYGNTFSPTEVRLITESADFAARLPRLFQRAFGLKFDRLPEEERGKLIFGITDRSKLDRIINQLGYDPRQNLVLHVNFGLLEDECCRTAFLRGAFLAGGSVTDPEKRYHLELDTGHAQASREVATLLTEMGFLPHSVRRGGSSVIYFKQSEHIEDLLTTIGAPAAAMDIMTAKVDKEIRRILEEQFERAKQVLLHEREALDRVVKYLIEYERITGEEFEKIFRNEPVELVSYKERKEALEKPDEEEKPEDESDDRTGDEPEQRHEGSGEDSSEDKPEKEAEQKFYRPGGFDDEDK